MHYKIVEYANRTVDVMYSSDRIRWGWEHSYEGEDAWEDAMTYIRSRVSERTVMREEIIDV